MTSPTVKTNNGVVRGLTDEGVMSFKGIPYGAPPVGDLRFAPPAPPRSWSGELDCTRYGNISLQPLDPLSVVIPESEVNFYHPGAVQDEDCLNLNVWTSGPNGARPVLVWIHGGGFVTGSGTGLWTEGATFVRRHDVVVVTINYRLGALGFLTLEDPQSDFGVVTNAGLLDQVAALRWVNENISCFGGDPDRVCVFGESAGAMSVSMLLATPAAAGLFSRAILQSGSAAVHRDLGTSHSITGRFAAKLGVSDDKDTLATLRAIDAPALLAAQVAVASETRLPFAPVVDGHHLPIAPIDAITAGAAASVPLIVGTNTDENKLFRLLGAVQDGSLADRLAACFTSPSRQSATVAPFVDELLGMYRPLSADDADVWDVVATDRMFRAPAWQLMAAQAKAGGVVFSYEFAVTTPVFAGRLGSCHALEIPFVFGDLRQPGVTALVGDDIAPGSVAASVSSLMNATWAEFARLGRPVHPDLPAWPEFAEGRSEQMCFARQAHVRDDPHLGRVSWWTRHNHLVSSPFAP